MKPFIYHGGDLKAVKLANSNVKLDWIDLSTGLNPMAYPWQKRVCHRAIERAAATLPQEEQIEACTNAWTKYLEVENPGDWLLTAGSQAIINILPMLFTDHQVVIPEPSYGEHERVWHKVDRQPIMTPRAEFWELKLTENQVFILTSPNNPDGYIWPPKFVLALAKELQEKNGYLVIDEAFADVAASTSIAIEKLPENLILLRSFGKFFGLAGLRLGLARIPKSLHKATHSLLGPWSANGPAAVIAEHALGDSTWIEQTRTQLHRKSENMRKLLEQTSGKFLGGTDLFNLIEHDCASELVNELNAVAIHVRSFEKHPKWLRFGLPADTIAFDRLKEALDD